MKEKNDTPLIDPVVIMLMTKPDILTFSERYNCQQLNRSIREIREEALYSRNKAHELYLKAEILADEVRRRAECFEIMSKNQEDDYR